jgi:predicted RND superfamily exporter protein
LLEEELGVVLRRELRACFVLGLVGNFLLLLFSFGSAGTAIAILAPVVLVIVALFAGMWITGIALDPVNLIVTPLLFGVGVDYGVYLVARARERGAVHEAVRYAGKAVVVTACTTITGFGFLGLSRFPALSTMGLLAGVGLFLCLALSILLLPALLTLLSPEWRPQQK